jgi:hypothetical protein
LSGSFSVGVAFALACKLVLCYPERFDVLVRPHDLPESRETFFFSFGVDFIHNLLNVLYGYFGKAFQLRIIVRIADPRLYRGLDFTDRIPVLEGADWRPKLVVGDLAKGP